MTKPKLIQRPIHIAIETFNKLQRAYLKAALKCKAGEVPKKSEFYTEIIKKGLEK